MAFTTQFDKTRKDLEKTLVDLEKTLADPTPLYAFVGVGDLAVEKIRTAREELTARAARLDPKTLSGQAQAKVTARVEAVQADAQALPTKAQGLVGGVVTTALSAYGDLAGRGKTLMTRVRKQQATADLQEQAQSTVRRAKATRTTAKKAATSTKSAAKATRTSARKTATATKKAAGATASKVGD